MKLPTAISLVFSMLSVGVYAQLPDELAHLAALAEDQDELVSAARRFDLQQQELIGWDRSLVEKFMSQGKPDLAATQQAATRKRVDLIRTAWVYVTDRYPNNARAVNYYGEFLYDYDNNQAKALQNWRVAVKLDDELAAAHNNLGIHFFHTGGYKNGLDHLQRALDLEDDNPDFLFNMSQMYLLFFPQLGRMLDLSKEKIYKEAMRMSKRATQFAPDDYDILLDYATNFYAAENFDIESDWEEAALAWQRARAKARTETETFFTFLNEGRTWLRSNKKGNAVKPLEEAAALRPQSPVVKKLLKEARRGAG